MAKTNQPITEFKAKSTRQGRAQSEQQAAPTRRKIVLFEYAPASEKFPEATSAYLEYNRQARQKVLVLLDKDDYVLCLDGKEFFAFVSDKFKEAKAGRIALDKVEVRLGSRYATALIDGE